MKNTVALAVLLLFSTLASAQSIGFKFGHGISTLCPDYSTFKNTLNQATSIGFFRVQNQGIGSWKVRSGFNVTLIRSCLSVTNSEGLSFDIPEKYVYLEMPLMLQKDIYKFSPLTRKATHYSVQGGVHLAYLSHEKGFEQRVGCDYETRPLNAGASAAFQWIRPLQNGLNVAFGPEVKVTSTGEKAVQTAIITGLKLDIRFGDI